MGQLQTSIHWQIQIFGLNMKQLNITLDVTNTSEEIIGNFAFVLSNIIKEQYPEIKFTDKSWYVETVELKKE